MKRFLLISICLASLSAHGQATSGFKNKIKFQIAHTTPILGVAYNRTIWQSKKYPLVLETGVGLGLMPFSYNSKPPFSVSHDVSLTYGRGFLLWTVGYASVIKPIGPLFRNIDTYQPTPHVGIIISQKKFFVGIEHNAYFYRTRYQEFQDENLLMETTRSFILFLPGVYAGFRF